MFVRRYSATLLLLLALLGPVACSPPDTAELGLPDTYPLVVGDEPWGPDLAVWETDLDAALALSADNGRPVMALYLEAGTASGAGGLTAQPLIAEAAEDLFIPVLLPSDPAHGEAGLRFVDATGHDLVPPIPVPDGPGTLALGMMRALEAGQGKVPEWFRLAAAENGAEERRMLTLAMFCYWEGEAKLGNLDGVLATRSGMMEFDEVVEVIYDPAQLDFEQLVGSARQLDCASAVYAHTAADLVRARELVGDAALPAPDRAGLVEEKQVKYALKRTSMARLPITPLQQTRINADIRLEANPRLRLSPRQVEMLKAIDQLLKQNSTALDDFSPPDKLSLLADYQSRLLARLAE